MSGKNSIQVAVKVRPLLKKEKDQQFFWRIVENSIQLVDSQAEPYYFDYIFDQHVNNQVIFDKVAKQIVHSAIQGFNGTIFAYGQTSSGKTYTMMGDNDNPGVMVLAAKEIFKEIERTQDRQFLLRVGYIEIYNEKIYDLLNKKNQDLKIHETSTNIVSVNCEEIIIRSEDDLLYHLDKGGKERTVGETNMNERSSRSHAIFRIIIESRKMDRSEEDAVIQSVLNLVDLAGSERADQTGARGTRLKEGGHINKSLLFLSNVIKQLSENEDDKYVSFRDSKLTRILQASLGGNALTAIICTIKPNAIEETQSTLNFALRAKTIKNKPQVNEIVSDATMMKRLEHEIKVLKTRLEEEQRKNESQIKVRQLEQRIKDEDLKIISCISLHSSRNREKRRRTWCPSSTSLDASAVSQPSALPVPIPGSHVASAIQHPSRLLAPKSSYYNTPLITMRRLAESPQSAPNTAFGLPITPDNLDDIDEEFAPAELVKFEMLSPLQTPQDKQLKCTTSITPKLIGCVKSTLAKVEHDLQELQSFTNLESKVDVQHEPILTLKHKVETLSQRNAELEKERLEYLQLKNDLEIKVETLREIQHRVEVLSQRNAELEKDMLQHMELKNEIVIKTENLTETQRRCDELQVQLSKLTNLNKTANGKIVQYEAELAELKKTNEKLDMENREAVNLEFEFKRHKNKAKLRENELLEALNEKDKEITKLEKSLNAISVERLQNSKEELLQKSLNEDCKADADGNVCIKCDDLQRLLQDNKKVTLEFEKLTLEYENLKLNYVEIEKENDSNKLKIVNLEEQQEKEQIECERLLLEVQQLKDQLNNLQHDYRQLNSENSEKQEECKALSKQIEVAKQEMVVLEEKFTKLELSWQEQQQTISDIELQYATIQTKYEQLQCQYEKFEATRGQSLTDCQRLEKENVDLQAEIDNLKKKVLDAQQRLLESNTKYEEATRETKTANEEYSSKTSKIQHENEQLKKQLQEIQTQFEDLQKEYDDLSNQLMDSLQDCDYLRNENIKLKEKLEGYDDKNKDVGKAEAEIIALKSQLEKVLSCESQIVLKTPSPCQNLSMRSSGVCVEEDFVDISESQELLEKFCELSESLTEIELEYTKGKTKLFKSASKNSTPTSYKMYLKNILGVRKLQNEFDMQIENIHLQGSFKHHSFHIVELSSGEEVDCSNFDLGGIENIPEYIEKLRQEITDLNLINDQERSKNKSLLESTERAFIEMREQITQLSAELLEKSIFVENCACKTYQQQIENLEKEKADMTLICEELQEKVNTTLNGSLLMNSTAQGSEIKSIANDKLEELEQIKKREQELLDSYDSQAKLLEEMTIRCLDVETELETAREQLTNQEKLHKEKYNQLQLENLQKLELSSGEYRDNMKKYNKEWEQKKDEYQQIINNLQNQVDELKQIANKAGELKLEVKKEQISNKNEFENESEVVEADADKLDTVLSDETETIKQDKCTLDVEIVNLQKQLNTTEEQLEHVMEENCTQYEEINLLSSRLVYLEELLADAKVLHVTLSRENASLKTEIEDIKADLECIPVLHDKNQQLSEEIENLKLENSQLKEKLVSSGSQMQEFSKDVSRKKLKKALKSELNNLTSMEEEKKKQGKDFENLNLDYQQVHDQLHKAEETIEELQKEIMTREELLKTLQTKVNSVTALEEQKKSLTTDFEKLNHEYKEVHHKLLKAEKQMADLQKENANREELSQSLPTNRSDVKSSREETLIQEYKQAHNKLLKMEEKLAEVQKEDAIREEVLKTLTTKLRFHIYCKEQHVSLANDYENLKQEYNQVKDKLLETEAQNEQLQKEDANREELLKTLQSKLNYFTSLEEKKNCLEIDFEKLKQEHKQLHDQLRKTDLRIEELEKEDASREKLLKTLQSKVGILTSCEEEKRNLSNDYENLKQEYKQVHAMLLKSEQQIKELCSEDSNPEDVIQSIQFKLSAISALEEEKKTLDTEVLKLKELINKQQEKEKENENETCEEVQTLRQQIQTLLERVSVLESAESKLQLEKTELEDKLRHATSEYELLHSDKILLKTQVNELIDERKSLYEQCSSLKEDKITLENQLKYLKEKEKAEEIVDQLTEEKAELLHNLRVLNEKLETTQSQLDESEKCMSHAREEKVQIQQDLQSLQKSLTKTIEEQNKQLEQTQREREQAKQDVTKAIEKNQEQQKKLEECQQQNAQLKAEVMKFEQEKLKQQKILDKAQREQDNLQKELRTMKESHSEIIKKKQIELSKLLQDFKRNQRENEELTLQVVQLSADLFKTESAQHMKSMEYNQLETELQITKISLIALQEEKRSVQRNLVCCEKLQADKENLEATLKSLQEDQTEYISSFQDERDRLLENIQRYEKQREEGRETEDILKNKIDSLTQELDEVRNRAASFEALVLEQKEVENVLISMKTSNQKLLEEIAELNSQKQSYVTNIENLSSKIENLNLQLDQQGREKQVLESKLSDLKETLQSEKCTLQKENQNLQSSLEELKLKVDSLQSANTQLENLKQQLDQQHCSAKEKLTKFRSLQDELESRKVQYDQLQQTLKETVEEAGRCSLTLREDVDRHKELLRKQMERYNALELEMETKQRSLSEEKFQLSAIIETLTKEKVGLEERVRQLTVRNFELDLQRKTTDATSTNTSLDSNASHSPKGRRSLERLGADKLANVSLEEKLSAIQLKNSAERKNRRLSTHDERRRQSYWGAAHDKETMTDPFDTSCNCVDLDRKLKDCERNLFIKVSQVTALNMELKNHPLKEENAALKKRLQEEQEKHRAEIKRCKSKLYEQTAKTEKALAAAAHATAKSTHADLLSEQVAPTLPKIVVDVETQTSGDVDACLQKLQGKYNDLKNICRYRYNLIKELEEKVSQKENSDGNSLTVLDAAQFKMLKNQCESLKKELDVVKEKYEVAKKVLLSRREEITKLRDQLGQSQ